MYIVTIYNNGIKTEIHGERQKLTSGNVVKGINAIDSFTMSLLPSNIGFDKMREYLTVVNVYNTNRKRSEFDGRVLYSKPSMSDKGLIKLDVTCESFLGYLCDSQQPYVETQNWTVDGLLEYLINIHNSKVEEHKRFVVGEVTVTDDNDNLYIGIQRKNTWETIKEKLINNLGGELRFRVVDGLIYIDYLKKIGETKSTAIKLSRNMKAISKEKDPSEYITRLIPLGAKLTREEIVTDEEGNETTQTVQTEERLTIASVNDGKEYIDDEQARAEFGIREEYKEWDDVNEPNILLTKAKNWLAENNKLKIKYVITALDLSLLGLDIDDFDVYNSHPIVNPLLSIDDIARIIKKNINVCEETKSTIEVGENFKTLSDLQIESSQNIKVVTQTIEKIESDYITNEKLTQETALINSLIKQSAENIALIVSEGYVSKSDNEEYKSMIETQLEVLADEIIMKFTTSTERIQEVDGVMQSKFEEIYNYISFAGGSIKLGASDSAITLTIENDMINFRKNGVTFGSWDGDYFYTGNIVVRVNERAQFGNFAYVPRSDGSLAVLKVGE